MSMPQYIEIAVVASHADGFKLIQGIGALNKAGIAPRYKLATIHRKLWQRIAQFDRLDPARIGLWVALDDESMQRCLERYAVLSSRPGYSRGFYDDLLPEAVVRVTDREAFLAMTEKVWDAFCASS